MHQKTFVHAFLNKWFGYIRMNYSSGSSYENANSSSLILKTPETSETSTMSNSDKDIQALVFGASGITGWAIANSALSYPTAKTFSRVIGLTSRPLSLKDSGLPLDPRLQLYSGLDLSQDAKTITEYLKKIENIDQITHVYFAGMLLRERFLGLC